MPKCPICLNLRTIKDKEVPFFDDVVLSAQSGCSNCSLIVKIVDVVTSRYHAPKPSMVRWKKSGNKLQISIIEGDIGEWYKDFDVYLQFKDKPQTHTHKSSSKGKMSVTEIEKTDTSSATTMQKAIEWISHCINSHSSCNVGSSYLPRRVIDVAKAAPDVVLVETDDQLGSYICLSHCWGKVNVVVTKENNLEMHKTKIPLESLSRTFSDAIEVTRKLKVRYLWIDSLCIIQDKSDWEKESRRMAQIYQNSYVTLAATKSSDGAGGLFARDTKLEIDGIHTDGRSYTATYDSTIWHWSSTPGQLPMTNFPLLRRGWVYQERLLSPRMLHFGPQELLWECVEGSHCECGSFGRASHPGVFGDYAKGRLFGSKEKSLGDSDNGHLWRRKVHEYSQLSLTRPSDKLPALSGLAQEEQTRRPETSYLAGLWLDTLLCDLMWFSTNTLKPETKRAPSWSWASLDGPIYFFDSPSMGASKKGAKFVSSLCRILDVCCRPNGKDPTGEMRTGHVTLSAQMRKATSGIEGRHVLQLHDSDLRIPLALSNPPVNEASLDCRWKDQNNAPDLGSVLILLRLATIECNWHSEGTQLPSKEFEISLILKSVSKESSLFERAGLASWDGSLYGEEHKETIVTII